MPKQTQTCAEYDVTDRLPRPLVSRKIVVETQIISPMAQICVVTLVTTIIDPVTDLVFTSRKVLSRSWILIVLDDIIEEEPESREWLEPAPKTPGRFFDSPDYTGIGRRKNGDFNNFDTVRIRLSDTDAPTCNFHVPLHQTHAGTGVLCCPS